MNTLIIEQVLSARRSAIRGNAAMNFYFGEGVIYLYSYQKVEIYLQWGEYCRTLYTVISGNCYGRDVLEEAMECVMDGLVYADLMCEDEIDEDFVELYKETKGQSAETVLERCYADEFIIGAKIIDCQPGFIRMKVSN